jgi:biopolymer transport protein ExbD
MLRTLIFSAVCAVFLSTACTPASQPNTTTEVSILSPANDSLYTLVVKIHDDIMPENATISSLQQQLKKQLPTLAQPQKDSLLPILAQLQIAYDGMMDWMRGFKNTEMNADEYKKWSEQETATYLRQEQAKIEAVADAMRQSITNAKAWKSTHAN